MQSENDYDVLICGGGLAGLTLARQLKLELPELEVAVIDRLARPLPEAAHKVGESSIEIATHYFGKVLKLEEYFARRHFPKLGLRFFFGDAHGPFEDRPELGPSLFPPVPSYQIDRGRLENDLRQIVADMGVEVYEDTLVEEIKLAGGSERHTVRCRRGSDSERFTLSGRWVVDALGRRRYLQSKLDLKQPNGHQASAAWWRVDARLDVTALGKKGDKRWARRNVEERYYSTNHLMGRGYWVWFIPLGSGATSLGIVTDETIHPFQSYGKSYQQALEWLHQYEPAAWELLKSYQPLDFHGLKNYSYHSKQIFSHNRWSCVGEAGLFLDPLYSLGSDFIAIGNTLTVELIRRDFQGTLTETAVNVFNQLVLDYLAPLALDYYKGTYATFGHAQIFTAKLAWDTALYWAMMAQLFFQGLILNPTSEIFDLLARYKGLNERVQRLFIDWAAQAPPRALFVPLADLTRMPLLQLTHLELSTRRTPGQIVETAAKNLDRFDELAQMLFWQAVKESTPEYLPVNRQKLPWVNAWAISLDPECWEADGLFRPASSPRSLRSLRSTTNTFAGIFAPMSWREKFQLELPYWLMHTAHGMLSYHLVSAIHRHLIHGRQAFWIRRLFVADSP